MFRLRFWLSLAVLLTAAPWQPTRAQQKPAPQAAAAQATTPFGTLSPEQARTALETLNDPKKRAAFAATLEALVKGQPASEPAPPATPPAAAPPAVAPPAPQGIAIQLAPDSLGAQVLLSASAFLNDTANDLPRTLQGMQSLPLLWAWVVVMATNPLGQQLLANAAWRLAIILALSLGISQALRVLLRRPMARVLNLGRPPAPDSAEEAEEDRKPAPNAARSNRRRGAAAATGPDGDWALVWSGSVCK